MESDSATLNKISAKKVWPHLLKIPTIFLSKERVNSPRNHSTRYRPSSYHQGDRGQSPLNAEANMQKT